MDQSLEISNIIVQAIKRQGGNKSEIARKIGLSSQLLGQYERGEKEPKMGFYIKWKQEFREDLYKEIETKVYNLPEEDNGVDIMATIKNDNDPTIKEILLIQLKTFDRQSGTLDKQTMLMESILNMMARQNSQAIQIEGKVKEVDDRTVELHSNLIEVLAGMEKLSIRQDSAMKEIHQGFSELASFRSVPSPDAGKKSRGTGAAGKKQDKTRAKRK